MNGMILQQLPGTVNGDRVIGYMDQKFFKHEFGHNDLASLSEWYREDPEKNDLGIIELAAGILKKPMPMFLGAIRNAGTIHVNGVGGSFTYKVPNSKSEYMMTTEDMSHQTRAGIDNNIVQIKLNRKLEPGDAISYDSADGEQLVCSASFEPRKEAGSWLNFCRLITSDRSSYFPPDKLRAGIKYSIVGHNINEFSTRFTKPVFSDHTSFLTAQFQLGNHRGVESSITQYAGMKRGDMAHAESLDFIKNAMQLMNNIGGINGYVPEYAYIAPAAYGSKGIEGFDMKNAIVASTLELFCMSYLVSLEHRQLMWQRAGFVNDEDGAFRMNEGWFNQYRRGYQIYYGRPGGINTQHLKTTADYLFRNSDLAIRDRKLRMVCGPEAYTNIRLGIMRNNVYNDLKFIQDTGLMGSDALIKNPVAGQNNGLYVNPIEFSDTVFLDGIGWLTIIEEPSLGYADMTDRSSLIDGKIPRSSYSAIIENMSDTSSSNAFTSGVPVGAEVRHGSFDKNVYLVRPKGESMWWGTRTGRWSPTQSGNIQSSMAEMAYGFWCHSSSAVWIKDMSKYVSIELQPFA